MSNKILLLHGSRQTGELLLGRMDKLRKLLRQEGFELVAPDAPFPHPENQLLRQWWNRDGDDNQGLLDSIQELHNIWANGNFVGIIGFSQGARMAHIITLCSQYDCDFPFKGILFVILVSCYDAPLPISFRQVVSERNIQNIQHISIPSLHVWGLEDKLVTPDQSRAATQWYLNPQIHQHEGGHHIPMKAASVRTYVQFVVESLRRLPHGPKVDVIPMSTTPDDDALQQQLEEVEAMRAIFPEEFHMVSPINSSDGVYAHPIIYKIDITRSEVGAWPPHNVSLRIQYPYNYPQESIPAITLLHDNNVMEFPTVHADNCLEAVNTAAAAEQGMPCVLACVYAAKQFFESGVIDNSRMGEFTIDDSARFVPDPTLPKGILQTSLPSPASEERISQCILQGLEIAEVVLNALHHSETSTSGNGGSWCYTIGLVGKPSAGKSTFFNAATAFARQRGDSGNYVGGAAMAPHPFTTIDPNIGFALAPAPPHSCPEDGFKGDIWFGSTHGRDNSGRRLLPILLKDVAGLVPGAYQGKGRGNQFLNDLLDAEVLVHILDSSGTADTEGNLLGVEDDGLPSTAASSPSNDLEWIRKELVEWIYGNVAAKWEIISRKGVSKLVGMFSGYGQREFVTWKVIDAVENFLAEKQGRETAFESLSCWDEGDLRRLVSAFLGVRFPMVLALNKCDLPTSGPFVREIINSLPIHGARVGVPLAARSEMNFVKKFIDQQGPATSQASLIDEAPPCGVWDCLQAALSLREPVLVFPVHDFVTYGPLPGLCKYASSDLSLPSLGMIQCISAAGGEPPSSWEPSLGTYSTALSFGNRIPALRDVLIMKRGSTVNDVFLYLKRLGALSGEFVRAEAAENIGTSPRPIGKQIVLTKSIRILKIMTSKRSQWQQK